MKPSCADCPYDDQTMHTIELNDKQFEMLKWAISSQKNFYNSVLKNCSPNDIEGGYYLFAVIVLWLNNLENTMKNS